MNFRACVGRILALLVAGFCALGAHSETPAPSDPPYDWNLEQQYPDEAAWTKSLDGIRARLAAFEKWKDEPVDSASRLADRLDDVRFLRGRAGHMARFAILHNQVDESSELARTRLDGATQMEALVEAGVTWLDAKTLALGKDKISNWMMHEVRLARHGDHLKRLLRLADHLPLNGSEASVAALERAVRMPTDVFDAMAQSDLGWPRIKLANGTQAAVDPGSFTALMRDPDRDIRHSADEAFLARLKEIEEPLGVLLTRRLGLNLDLARARHYANPIDMFFDWGDGLPEGTYKHMLAAARSNRSVLQRFARLVARVNGLRGQVGLADLYVSAPKFERTFEFNEAIDNIVAAWAPLGSGYQAVMRERLAKPWMDWRPRPHKSGVGVYWGVNDSDPYTVLTFDGRMAGSKTLAQAAGSIVFLSSMPAGKLHERREDDFPVYGNAVWFLGQMLYDEYLIAHVTDKRERISILYDDCRRLWANYFPYAMYVELEEKIYSSIEKNHPLSGKQIAREYLQLLHDYYGGENSMVNVEDEFAHLPLLDGNSYYGEVLAEWGFAMASAASMAERLHKGDTKTIDALIHPMANPDSFTSQDLLLDAVSTSALRIPTKPSCVVSLG